MNNQLEIGLSSEVEYRWLACDEDGNVLRILQDWGTNKNYMVRMEDAGCYIAVEKRKKPPKPDTRIFVVNRKLLLG